MAIQVGWSRAAQDHIRFPLLSAKKSKLRLQLAQPQQILTAEDWKNVTSSDRSQFLLPWWAQNLL